MSHIVKMSYHQKIFVFFSIALLFVCCTKSLPVCQTDKLKFQYPVIAHSHNDYDQDNPINTALEHGFGSIEVDIIYDGLDIRVSHDDKDLADKPLFKESYLIPIVDYVKTDSRGIYLLVDIKEYSDTLISKLNLLLEEHFS
jgi:hypothetical protein